jgi:hypothetical protein
VDWLIFAGIVALAVVLGVIAQRAKLIDLSGRRRNAGHGGGGIFTIGDEVFAPTKHEAAIELERQSYLPAPAPLAGDGEKGIYNGRLVIDVTQRGKR